MVHSHLRFSQLLHEPELIVEQWVTLYYMGAFTPAIWSTIVWTEKFNNGLCLVSSSMSFYHAQAGKELKSFWCFNVSLFKKLFLLFKEQKQKLTNNKAAKANLSDTP